MWNMCNRVKLPYFQTENKAPFYRFFSDSVSVPDRTRPIVSDPCRSSTMLAGEEGYWRESGQKIWQQKTWYSSSFFILSLKIKFRFLVAYKVALYSLHTRTMPHVRIGVGKKMKYTYLNAKMSLEKSESPKTKKRMFYQTLSTDANRHYWCIMSH